MRSSLLTEESDFPKAMIELENGSEFLVSVDSGISGYFSDLPAKLKINLNFGEILYTCHINVGN